MDKPSDLATRGSALWDTISEANDLDEGQSQMLAQACRVADRCDALAPVAAADPEGAAGKQELAASQQLARLMTALRLPDEHGRKPQLRGQRGTYKPPTPGVSSRSRLAAV